MVTLLTNSFAGGSQGTTITAGNSGGASGNAFDIVFISGTGSVTYDSTETIHSPYSVNLTNGSPAGIAYVAWSTSLTGSSVAQVWARAYIYLPSLPSGTIRAIRWLYAGPTVGASIGITSAGKIACIDSAGTAQTTSTTVIPLNQWVRIEAYCIGNSSTGQLQVKIFTSPDAGTATETDTTAATLNTGGPVVEVTFGNPQSVASYTFWMANLGVCDTNYVGPVNLSLVNNFETSTPGTTLSATNSAGGGNNPFDASFIGPSYTLTYDNTYAASGSLSMNVTAGTTATEAGVYWTSSIGTNNQVWFRYYGYLTSNPSGGSMVPFGLYSGASVAGWTGINTSGLLALADSTFVSKATFTNAVPLNQWFRVEGYITGNASTGVMSASLYSSANSTVATETHTVTGVNTLGLLTQCFFGQDNHAASLGTMWIDNAGVSNTGYLGPYVAPYLVLTNNFEGGTNGTTLAGGVNGNTGGASGSYFDTQSIGTNATLAFDNTHVAHGSLACKTATGATNTNSFAEWNLSEGTQKTVYFRVYCYATAAVTPPWRPFEAASGSTHAGSFLLTNRTIQMSAGSGFTGIQNFTTQMPLNQWVRFEGYVTGDPAAGVVSLSLYTSPDSAAVTETHTVTGLNTAGLLTNYWFGQLNTSTSSGPFWFDDIGISPTGYLGPAVSLGGGSPLPALMTALP